MIRNGVMYDYCFQATIKCLRDLCDDVIVVLPKSDDNTLEMVLDTDPTLNIIECTEPWESIEGKYKLSHFSNIGLQYVREGYSVYLQADEVIHEDSFPWIWEACNRGETGYMVSRLNLWATPDHILNVPHEKMPCSPYVMRIGKAGVLSYDDAESLAIDNVNTAFSEQIKIFHYGFIRDWKVMKSKVINMQTQVFGFEKHDERLDGSDVFDPFAFFSKEDLIPHGLTHPKYAKDWIKQHEKQY